MEDLTGRQFGAYTIVAPIGEGGMAAVYRAYQSSVDRTVALKVLPQRLAGDAQFEARFEREARVVAHLQHPHILPVFDFGEHDGYTWFAMPFVAGGTLGRRLTGTPVPLQRVLDIMKQVCDALEYAHSKGVIHRDIKPSNILIDERDNCLVTDFGVAKLLESNSQLTTAGGLVGTPAYMAPEQAMSEPVTHRSDIYSLSIVLYEMLAGRVPYKAETPLAMAFKHAQGQLPMPRTFNASLPTAIEQVIVRGLARRPEDRFGGCLDLYRALESASRLFDHASVAEVTEELPVTPRDPLRRSAAPAAGAANADARPAERTPPPGPRRTSGAPVPAILRPPRFTPPPASSQPLDDLVLQREPPPPAPARQASARPRRLQTEVLAAAGLLLLVVIGAIWWTMFRTAPRDEGQIASNAPAVTTTPAAVDQPADQAAAPPPASSSALSTSVPEAVVTPTIEVRPTAVSSSIVPAVANTVAPVTIPAPPRPRPAPPTTMSSPPASSGRTTSSAPANEAGPARVSVPANVDPPPASAPPSVTATSSVTAPTTTSAPAPSGDRPGGSVSPRKIKNVLPVYPQEAVDAGVEGTVTLLATVDTAGKVIDAKVLRSIPLLDAAAIAAVKQWEYEPTTIKAREEPVAIPVTLIVSVTFSMK